MRINLNHYIEKLHIVAKEKSGLEDFGDPLYMEALAALLDASWRDYRMTPEGQKALHDSLIDHLIGRLYSEHGWKKDPSILSFPIKRPLVIVGLPRTGTTALHKLLSCDPQFQGLELWIARRPMKRPKRELWEHYAEYRELKLSLDTYRSNASGLTSIHRWDADEVEECSVVMWQSFMNWTLAIQSFTYANWINARDWGQCYHRYGNVLRLIGAEDLNRIWLLKCPAHTMTLDSLLEVFPDANIIHTHRDPADAIPSWYSLHNQLYSLAYRPRNIDVIGRRMCDFWHTALERSSLFRERLPSQVIDVEQRSLNNDPLSVVHSIYEKFGLRLSADAELRMRSWISTRGPRVGSHRYDLSSFNVDIQEIREMFRHYREMHNYS